MSSTLFPVSDASRPRLRWSVNDYERVVALGGFPPDKRVELIEGEIVDTMPQSPRHASTVELAEDAVRRVLIAGFRLRIQLPLRLSESMPEPDLAVVQGELRAFVNNHPTTAALLIEVSDTTLEYDRTVKAQLYAAAEIAEYWIVNLNERTLEVRRQPSPSGYRNLQTLTETEEIAPLFAANQAVHIAALLP